MSNEKTHWLQSPNKNYLGHWDLPESGEMIVTIQSAQWEEVKDPVSNKKENKRVIRFKEDIKPLICNQTNAASIIQSGGRKFMEDSAGLQICLYVDRIKDKRTKEEVDCIRIRSNNPYTLDALVELRDQKTGLLAEKILDSINSIIMNEEATSYQKAINYLKGLK